MDMFALTLHKRRRHLDKRRQKVSNDVDIMAATSKLSFFVFFLSFMYAKHHQKTPRPALQPRLGCSSEATGLHPSRRPRCSQHSSSPHRLLDLARGEKGKHYELFIITYLPHKAVAEVSKDKEPIGRERAEFNWFESQLMSDSSEVRFK